MKTSLRYLIPLLSFATALPLMRAADEEKPIVKKEKKEMRVIGGINTTGATPEHRELLRRLVPGEMESATFLGVETAPVSATLTAQLGLQEGAGLVVAAVVPDSPAAAALKPHDILLKLDDQLLVEQRQLAVLVRNHKEGDEVTLTFLRGGKQTTAKVKLAKHDVPKLAMEWTQAAPVLGGGGAGAFAFGPGVGNGNFGASVPGNARIAGPEDINRLLGLIDRGMVPGQQRMNVFRSTGGPGDRTINVTVNTGNSHVVLDDEKGSLDLTMNDGKKELVAKNAKGEQIFSGPINSPEERRALPEEVRSRLEKLEDTTQFSFKTDGDFKGAETKIVRPRGQGIAVPLRAPEPVRRSLFF